MYIDDLVNGLIMLMNSNYSEPVNLGNPDEYRIIEFAETIRDQIGNNNPIVRLQGLRDDPRRRKPDISRAKKELNWEPKTSLKEGLSKTIAYFKNKLNLNKERNTVEEENEDHRKNIFYAFDKNDEL